jgi:guanylate kinase
VEEGLLIVVSGPSGCGKGTICNELLKRNNNVNISISATTRKPRVGEIDGQSYFFVSEEKFKEMIENNEFIEYAHVHSNFYGTPKKFVLDKLGKGEDVLLEIDVQGALQIKKIYPKGVYIFILPPSMDELKDRIIKRGTETESDILKRLKTAYEELNYAKEYDYLVVNDELLDAVGKVESIITAEKCKTERKIDIIKNIIL